MIHVRRRRPILVDTGVLVIVLVAVKALLGVLSFEFVSISPLYGSIVAGGIFVVALIVSGTLADYKEAERLPAEMAATLENILEDGLGISETVEGFDTDALRERLLRVVTGLKMDLVHGGQTRGALEAVDGLSPSFIELERLGVPPNYIVRLRTEQGNLRRMVLRIYQMQQTDFLPSANVLIKSVVALIIVALELTRIDPVYEGLLIVGFISYFFIYLTKLLSVLDTPFRVGKGRRDDVSLFLVDEFAEKVRSVPRPGRASGIV